MTEYYGYRPDPPDRLEWVRRGVNLKPTAGSPEPHTLFTYDPLGRPVQRQRRYVQGGPLELLDLTWDGDDRLREARRGGSPIFIAGYNSSGLRTFKSDLWTGSHTYTWGLEGLLHDSDESTLIAPGIGEQKNGVPRYFHSDWLGSTRYQSDAASIDTGLRRYDAFGQLSYFTGPIFPSAFGFGGLEGYQSEYFDASEPGLGLQYLEQRYSDPAIGRFLTPDPIGWTGGLNLSRAAPGRPLLPVNHPDASRGHGREEAPLAEAKRHLKGCGMQGTFPRRAVLTPGDHQGGLSEAQERAVRT